MKRADILAHYRAHPNPTVLVVGGGVNGIGVWRELALQGLDVLLVEKRDFCSGSSAASSHMLHGGIRYLENGEFRLVREALHERNLMLRNAPHLAKPLPTTIPLFKRFSGFLNAPLKFLDLLNKPRERGALVIKIGLTFYDFFVRGQSPMPKHRFYSRAESLAKRPQLNPKIIATATYYDAWMPSPERICMELIRDTEAACPQAHALNYVALVGGEGAEVIVRDALTGESLTLRPKLLINAAGPWIDFANQAIKATSRRLIGGTKGSHLVVDNADLHAATDGGEIFFENDDGRIVLIFPIYDRVLMGTTDIRIDDPDQAVCTPEEEAYILNLVKKVFPDIHVQPEQVVFRYSGVRPLPYSEVGSTAQISRDHSIEILPPSEGRPFPVYSLVGGKWTTWRAFSQQTADKALAYLGAKRSVDTAHLPIGGGKDYPADSAARDAFLRELADETRLPMARLETLFERYGTGAAEVAAYLSAAPDAPLASRPDYSQREVQFIAEREKVVHVDDFLLRRSLLALLGYVTPALLDEVAAALAPVLGWSGEKTAEESARAREILHRQHGVAL